MATHHFTLEALRHFVAKRLARLGLAACHIGPVAETIVAGERDGGGSHGLFRLIMVARTLREGLVNPDAKPLVIDVAPGLSRVDADGGFAPLAFEMGLPMLVDKARSSGISALTINHCAHFSALFPEVEAIARAGLVGLCFTPSHAWVAPAGGSKPLFGTNPLAFSWPRPGGDPFVVDFATSASSRGDIELRRRAGEPLPEGWGIDPQGRPSVSPDAVLAGAMLPFGGHKGSALSLMVELIAGPLIGDMTSTESLARDAGRAGAPLGGELVIAMDPVKLMGNHAESRRAAAESIFGSILDQGARLPSARRYANRVKAEAEGVEVSQTTLSEIDAICAAPFVVRQELRARPE